MATFLPGKGSTIKVTSIGSVLTDFSDIASNVSLPLGMNTSDVSAFTQAYQSFIAGQYSGTLSFDFSFDATKFAILMALFLAGTATAIEYSPAGSAVKFAFTGIITSLPVTSAVGDAVKGSVSFQVTGAITYS